MGDTAAVSSGRGSAAWLTCNRKQRRSATAATLPDMQLETPSMTNQLAISPDAEAEIRWRDWQTRGAESDRRTATTIRRVIFLIVAGLTVWLFVQLA